MPVDDPNELFDLCDAEGQPLGTSKPRALVHRDGDWHRTVHVWVIFERESGPSVLFQRRSLMKDSHPAKVDVSVAGHLRLGETVEDAFRESQEEIGLVVDPREVVPLGVRRYVDDRPPSHVDRELQEVFFVVTPRTLESLSPDRSEVLALLEVTLQSALTLCEALKEEVPARELRVGDPVVRDGSLYRFELVPHVDGYFAKTLRSIADKLEDPLRNAATARMQKTGVATK